MCYENSIDFSTRTRRDVRSNRELLLSSGVEARRAARDELGSVKEGAVQAFVASGYTRELDDPELRRRLRAREVRNDLSRLLGEAGADIGSAFTAETAGSRLFAAGPGAPAQSSGVSIRLRATVLARNNSIGYSQILGIPPHSRSVRPR